MLLSKALCFILSFLKKDLRVRSLNGLKNYPLFLLTGEAIYQCSQEVSEIGSALSYKSKVVQPSLSSGQSVNEV